MSARELADLCADLVPVPRGVQVTDLTLDSRKVSEGGLFLACAGRRTHGLASLAQAIARGVRAVLWEPAAGVEPPVVPPEVFAAPVAQLSRHASVIADRFFDTPSATLRVSGITGTNGKTTCTYVIDAVLRAAGHTTTRIGTIGYDVAGVAEPAANTTPESLDLFGLLARTVEAGGRYATMEVSSHALDQARVDGVRFRVAAFTNLTRDHLDYHGSMQAYWTAKRRLFAWPGLQAAVLNIDDDQGAVLAAELATQAPEIDLWTVSTHLAARLQALEIEHGAQGLQFTVVEGAQRCLLRTRIIGGYNVSNLLGVIASLRALGIDLSTAVQACGNLPAVPGRLQCLGGHEAPLAVVDYAHTPDALQKTLEVLRPVAQQRGGALWCVFGCGGDRDNAKRPLMGAIAASKADHIVLTSDNPRTENPASIISHILAGMGGQPHIHVQADRAQAIAQALTQADARDVVLIAGKGHEAAQEVAGQKFIFSDADHADIALALRAQRMAA